MELESTTRFRLSTLSVIALCLLQAPSAGPGLAVSEGRRLQLTHRTVVRLTEPVEALRVTHPRPLEPAYFRQGLDEGRLTGPHFVDDPFWTPALVRSQGSSDGRGELWVWESADLAAGEHEFLSRFSLSCARRRASVELESSRSAVHEGAPDGPVERRELPAGLAALATRLEGDGHDPLQTVRAFARWVGENVAYDLGVRYATWDLPAIFQQRKGWCGHQTTLFLALCQAVDLPAREVFGFLLLNRTGALDELSGALGGAREDGNSHVWAEVYLPSHGWVEVEPTSREDPFDIPATYVQNPRDVQTLRVEVLRGGRWSRHTDYSDSIQATPEPALSLEAPFPAGEERAYRRLADGSVAFLQPAGSPVLAPARGRVVAIYRDDQRSEPTQHARGTSTLLLDHGRGRWSDLFGLATRSIAVRVGQGVEGGQLVATSARTPLLREEHLGFTLRDPSGQLSAPLLAGQELGQEGRLRSDNQRVGRQEFSSDSRLATGASGVFAVNGIELQSILPAAAFDLTRSYHVTGRVSVPAERVFFSIRRRANRQELGRFWAAVGPRGEFELEVDPASRSKRLERQDLEYTITPRGDARRIESERWLPFAPLP